MLISNITWSEPKSSANHSPFPLWQWLLVSLCGSVAEEMREVAPEVSKWRRLKCFLPRELLQFQSFSKQEASFRLHTTYITIDKTWAEHKHQTIIDQVGFMFFVLFPVVNIAKLAFWMKYEHYIHILQWGCMPATVIGYEVCISCNWATPSTAEFLFWLWCSKHAYPHGLLAHPLLFSTLFVFCPVFTL